MNFKCLSITLIAIFLLFFNNAYSLNNQKGYLIEMKNGESINIALNKTIIIRNIWKEKSLRDFKIKIKVLTIQKDGAQIEVISPTFLGKDFNESRFIEIGDFISIIQSEEITSKVELKKVTANKVTISLRVQSAPPAPELSKRFDVEFTDKDIWKK